MNMELSVHHSYPHISLTFAIIILLLSLILTIHIGVIFWHKREQLNQKNGYHVSLGNHLTMAMSMITGLSFGVVFGGLEMKHLFLAYLLGLVIGTFIGVILGIPFQHIAILDGIASGLMSGLMGVMIGSMVPILGFYTISILLMILFIISWLILLHFLTHFKKTFTEIE